MHNPPRESSTQNWLTMAPHGEAVVSSCSNRRSSRSYTRPPKLPTEKLRRTISDISYVECECCRMSEEFTLEYVKKVREKHSGRWICGLCSEAVKEEREKEGGKGMEEALDAHMSHCARFNKLGRAYPVLLQAQAMREMLRKSGSRARGKSTSPKDNKGPRNGGITRSSSCIPALTRDIDSSEWNK